MILDVFHKPTGKRAKAVQFDGNNGKELEAFCAAHGSPVSSMPANGSVWLMGQSGKLRVDLEYWLTYVDEGIDYISNESYVNLFDTKPPKKLPAKPVVKPSKKKATKGKAKSAGKVKKEAPPVPAKKVTGKSKKAAKPFLSKKKADPLFKVNKKGMGWSINAELNRGQIKSLLQFVKALNESASEAMKFNE